MEKQITYQREIITVEKKLGFLYVPAKARDLLPKENGEVNLLLPGTKNPEIKSYNADHNRIFGMTQIYSQSGLKTGDMLSVEITKDLINL